MKDLIMIKKHYGEKMMQLCRKLFPTILEHEGQLFDIIKNSFSYSKILYDDIINNKKEKEFEEYILKKINIKQEKTIVEKTPKELMKEAGYELYECKDERQIHSFRKYYTNKERLCTFKGGRLEKCFVFFAVKENAEKLKREDYKIPMREDEYGTSVISIQFSKNNNTLSIKNRYNHTVQNPDATYGNNLENIIPGLTHSFEKEYGLNINKQSTSELEIPGYINVNGKMYKYNYEINNVYYCPNNIIIENGIIKAYPHEQYIIMDYFILDKSNKTLKLYDKSIKDGLIYEYKNISRIEEKKENNKKTITLETKEGHQSTITLNSQNQIIEYINNDIKIIENQFLEYNKTINKLELNSVRQIKNSCFVENRELEFLSIPNLIIIGNRCFEKNNKLKELSISRVEYMDECCFEKNTTIRILNIENIIKMEDYCFTDNEALRYLYAPKLKEMGNFCFKWNKIQECINISDIEKIGYSCFSNNKKLKCLYIPKIKILETDSFRSAPLEIIYAPNLIECKSRTINNKQKSLKRIN
jgi:hypothetical protein